MSLCLHHTLLFFICCPFYTNNPLFCRLSRFLYLATCDHQNLTPKCKRREGDSGYVRVYLSDLHMFRRLFSFFRRVVFLPGPAGWGASGHQMVKSVTLLFSFQPLPFHFLNPFHGRLLGEPYQGPMNKGKAPKRPVGPAKLREKHPGVLVAPFSPCTTIFPPSFPSLNIWFRPLHNH